MDLRFFINFLVINLILSLLRPLEDLPFTPPSAHDDPIIQTMEDFSGYPPIQEPPVSNSEKAQQNQIRIVQVNNLSLCASTRSITLFFSSCGDIESVEMQSNSEQSQIAFVTFKHSLGADCAIMLSGTKLLDLTVIITLAPGREIQSTGSFPYPATGEKATDGAESYLFKTKDVFSTILEKGYVLGKAFAVVTSDKVQQVDQNLQVSKKVKSAVAKSSSVLSNQYVSVGASKDVFSTILEKGYVLGKAFAVVTSDKVQQVDQNLQVSKKVKSAVAKSSSVLSNQYASVGASKDAFSTILEKGYVLGKAFAVVTSDKVQQVDQNLQVSKKVKSAVAKSSSVLSNQYGSLGASKDVFSTILEKGYVLGKAFAVVTSDKVQQVDQNLQVSKKVKSVVAKSSSVLSNQYASVGASKDAFSTILEKGYVLGKAFAVVTSDKVQQVDQNLQVSKKVKSAVAKSSSVLSNQYVSVGASWVTVAFDSISKAAAEVSQHAKEKVAIAEEEQRRITTAEEEQRRKPV